MTSIVRAYGTRSPHSHDNVILIMTSFATELATPSIADEHMDTLLRLIYKDNPFTHSVTTYTLQ